MKDTTKIKVTAQAIPFVEQILDDLEDSEVVEFGSLDDEQMSELTVAISQDVASRLEEYDVDAPEDDDVPA